MTTLYELVASEADRLKQAGVAFGHGTRNAFDEAAWLVTAALGLPLDALESQAKKTLDDAKLARARAVVDRRIESREPAAYVLGEAWLQDVPFTIDRRAIVPRSYIAELLVDPEASGTLDAWLSDETKRVLDLCTGNGSLACLAALVYPEVTVDASDVSAEALEVARLNIARHGLGSRVRAVESDLFAGLGGRRYDLVLCNPPYVTDASMAALPAEYRAEPALALAGGVDGMDVVRRIVADVAAHLSDDGVLVLEVGHERANFEAAFPRLECAWLETSGGDDCVVLVERRALDGLGGRSASRSRAS